MGVPLFFQWLSEKYPGAITMFQQKDSIPKQIDNLYIDGNGIWHQCTQKVYQYGAGKPRKSYIQRKKVHEPLPPMELKKKAFREMTDYIETLFNMVQPKKYLIITIDGVGPVAKMNQQRQRRFRAAAERTSTEEKNGGNKFDSNSITPGTEFLSDLSTYIDWFIRFKITRDESWQNITVVFSSDKVPGEGEHKILEHIRRRAKNENLSKETHCMYGLDADLFSLSLGTHLNKFYLLREDVFSYQTGLEFHWVDLSIIRNGLFNDLTPDMEQISYNKRYVIDDFILMCFLVGNDFLHALPTLTIREEGMKVMIEHYRDTLETHGYLTRGKRVNIPAFRHFLSLIGNEENLTLQQRIHFGEKFRSAILEDSIVVKKKHRSVDFAKWRGLYYSRKFGANTPEAIREIVRDYLVGIKWVNEYYKFGCPDWHWLYKHHHTPLASDIAEYLQNPAPLPKFNPDALPLLPFQQLISVLPPASASLLPEPFHAVFKEKDMEDLYPDDFEVDLDGVHAEWAGVVILPFIDVQRIIEKYREIEKKIYSSRTLPVGLAKELERNKKGQTYEYFHSPSTSYNFNENGRYVSRCSAKTIRY